MDSQGRTKERWSWRGDADVPAFPDNYPLIVFDGECILCCANAQFVLKHDHAGRFRLTTAQGQLGQALYRHFGLATDHHETLLVIEDGRLLTRADAALAIASGLGWPWRSAKVARIVPRPLRDFVYDLVARNRFRLFGRRDRCWMPSPEIAERIL